MEFLEGKIIAWLINTDNIEQFEPGKPIECLFLDTLTDPGVEPIKRSAYAAYMITKLVRRLAEMGSQGVEITKVYGASRTPSGIRILKSGGFQVIREYDSGAATFELDIMNSKEKILKGYQNAFQEWKSNQKDTDKSRRKRQI